MSFQIFEGPLRDLLEGQEVQREVAEKTDGLVALVKQTISRPYPGGLNPPPGPPFLRSSDLYNSIVAIPPHRTGDGIVGGVAATAVHRGARYGDILLDRGYIFLDLALLG